MGNTFSCSTTQSSDNLKSSMSDLPKSPSGKAGYQVPPPPPPRPRQSGRNVKEEAPPLPAKVPLTARTNDVTKEEMTSSSPQKKTDATGQGPVSNSYSPCHSNSRGIDVKKRHDKSLTSPRYDVKK